MAETITETLARPARTGLQGGTAEVLIQFYEAFLSDLTEAQHVALLGLLTLLLGFIQVAVENHTGHALLRKVPPTEVPPVD